MGYRIEYRSHGKVHFHKRIGKPIPKWCVVTACGCLVLAALVICWQNEQLRNLLLPGDTEVTAKALQELVNDLRNGAEFGDAVTAFCIEVIENAKISR